MCPGLDPSNGATLPVCALLRADAGPTIGLGHLWRCLSLGEALRRSGAKCVFLTNGVTSIKDQVTAFGFDVETLDGVEPGGVDDLAKTFAMAGQYPCDIVVVDSYSIGEDYLERLRGAGLFVVAIDDLAPHPFSCQVVANEGAHAHELPYRSSSGDTKFLLGPKYALLRPGFWEVPPRTVRRTVENVLVTLGGADRHNLMPRLLDLLDKLAGRFTVTAIVGPFFENRLEIEDTAKRCRRSVRLVNAPDSLRDLMLEADLAISAGGHSVYELAAAGTPVVTVQVADNQAGHLRTLAAEGVVRLGGGADEPGLLTGVEAATRWLLQDHGARIVMSTAGRGLVDGQGAIRLVQAIRALREVR